MLLPNGSVVATYKDTEGNELAPQESVQTNAEPNAIHHYGENNRLKVDEVDVSTRTTTYTLDSTPATQQVVLKMAL